MRRDLLLVSISLFIWGIGEGMFYYFEPVYLQQLGADPIRIGAILGIYGATMAAAFIPAGYLSDRFGRRPLMWTFWFLGLIAAWTMALASGLTVFVIGLVIYGLTSFVTVPLSSYVTAARGKWSVGRAVMLIGASFNLGMIFGPLIGGFIGERFGLKLVFLGAGCLFIISTSLVLLIRPQPIDHHPAEQKRNGFLANPRYITYLIAVFLVVFAIYLPQPLAQNYLHNEHGLSLIVIGELTSMAGLGVVVLNILLGYIDERLGFLIAQAAVGGFAFLLWKGNALPWFAVGYFLLGGYKTTRSLATAQTRSLVHAADMGLAYGTTETVATLGVILAPPLAGYLYTLDPTRVFAISLGLLIVSLIVSLRFSPRPTISAQYSGLTPVEKEV
jgi:MFS family permease